MFAYSTKNVIYVVRFDGTHFVQFTTICNPDLSSDIIQF